MTAEDLLRAALAVLVERGAEYDNGRERSMVGVVDRFNAATDREIGELTVVEGWRFMQCVKRERLEAFPRHVDSAVDLLAYVALEMEQALAD